MFAQEFLSMVGVAERLGSSCARDRKRSRNVREFQTFFIFARLMN
jgi:hypothetical protein